MQTRSSTIQPIRALADNAPTETTSMRCPTDGRCRLGRALAFHSIVVLLAAVAVSGCARQHINAPNTRHRILPLHHRNMVAVSHQALPSGGFATPIQTPIIPVPATAIDPTASISGGLYGGLNHGMPHIAQQSLRVPSQTDIIDAWDQFQNPYLRVLQEDAMRTAYTPDEIVARILESAEYGGAGLGDIPPQNASDLQRLLLQRVAEAFVDVRKNQQLLSDCYLHLNVQNEALGYAQKRNEDGKSGKLDVVAISAQIGATESAMAPIRTKLRESLKRMSVLTSQVMTPARIKSFASQPQLSLPSLNDRLPASVLRQRCDVRGAEQRVSSMAAGQGIPEASLLPHLALEGELTAKSQTHSGKPDRNDQFGLNLGEKESWGFVSPGNAGGQNAGFQSPLQQSMSDYQNTVVSAASDVEALLTEYHVTLHEVKKLEHAVENSQQAMRLVLQQFEVDRTDGNVVAATAQRMYQVSQSLPKARARLSAIAIQLFKTIGGECNSDRIPSATYYQQMDWQR